MWFTSAVPRPGIRLVYTVPVTGWDQELHHAEVPLLRYVTIGAACHFRFHCGRMTAGIARRLCVVKSIYAEGHQASVQRLNNRVHAVNHIIWYPHPTPPFAKDSHIFDWPHAHLVHVEMWSSALRNCAERISLLELTLLAQLSRLELGSRLTICSAVIDSMGSSLQIFCIRLVFFSQPCMLYACLYDLYAAAYLWTKLFVTCFPAVWCLSTNWWGVWLIHRQLYLLKMASTCGKLARATVI